MPFIYRDAEGSILAVYDQPVAGVEEVAADDPGLQAFIQKTCWAWSRMTGSSLTYNYLVFSRI